MSFSDAVTPQVLVAGIVVVGGLGLVALTPKKKRGETVAKIVESAVAYIRSVDRSDYELDDPYGLPAPE